MMNVDKITPSVFLSFLRRKVSFFNLKFYICKYFQKLNFKTMLIEFTVENFRSIRNKQTFTMEAFGSKFLLENNVGEVALAGGKKMHLLKSAVILWGKCVG